MSKRGSILQDDSDMSEINISPMIDMVFILLIFFIVTTVFVQEPGVEVDREYAVTSRDLERNSILIAVTNTGTVHYGGREVGVLGVRAEIQRNLQDNERMPVIIQADRQAPSGVVIRVLEQARIAGANVFISTAHSPQ